MPRRYISEEALAKEFIRYICHTYEKNPQTIHLTKNIREGMDEYKRVRDYVLIGQDIDPQERTMDLRDYVRYILNSNNIERKRQLVQLFDFQLYLHDRKLTSTRFESIS